MTNVSIHPHSLKTVHLKYFLGEFVLGIWRPKLWVCNPADTAFADWPPMSQQLWSQLDPIADGVLCHEVAAGDVALGIGRQGPFVSYATHVDVLYSVAIQGSFQDYLKKFSSKSRQNLTRSVRRFGERQGDAATYEVYTQPAQMAEFHAQAVAISRQTYQSRLLKAGLPEDEGFKSDMVELARQGMARGYLLRDGGQAIAFAWCRGKGQRLIYNIIGYLPSAVALSPGTILLYHILEDLFFASQFNVIDFGNGEAQYKAMFATDKSEMVSAYYFRPTLKNVVLVRLHWWLFCFSGWLGHVLERLGLKARIKRLLRQLKGT